MSKITFSGKLPDTAQGRDLFRKTVERFNQIKTYLLESSPLPREQKLEELAEKFGVDSFMVDDAVRVVRGDIEPQLDVHSPRVFWSLGRKVPRHGMPWASLVLDESDNCSLGIRWGGSFDDEEDPPRWVLCRLSIAAPNLSRDLFGAATIDVWLTVAEDQLEGTLQLS